MPLPSEARKKTYTPPRLNKLTPEQANLILLGHASCGDQGAKDLLDVLYPPRERDARPGVGAHLDQEKRGQSMSGRSRLIHRALTALQSTREDFRRLIRG